MQFGFPEIEFFACEGVDGLIGAAVVLVVADGITDDPGPIAVVWAGNFEFDRGLRLFVDACVVMAPTRIGTTDGDVGGKYLHANQLWLVFWLVSQLCSNSC